MPQQSLTATVEQCRDSFNDYIVSIKSTAEIKIPSSVLREVKFCSQKLVVQALARALGMSAS